MNSKKINALLNGVRNGKLDVSKAMNVLRTLPFEDLGFAKLDTHRELRCGVPEVIFCKGKTIDQITKIAKRLLATTGWAIATKASKQIYQAIKKIKKNAVYYETAKIVAVGRSKQKNSKKRILIISAGTADIPVAEEAAVTAELLGNSVERTYDIGVAGIHRLFKYLPNLVKANVIIVVAGMEGALASIVGGLVDKPVIAVPTSIGYGASFDGLAALLSMLNCCAPGVTVVNIDNGFGAGYFASMINRMGKQTCR
ncbi:nickel pincer cofactor biosynthesis protein LarB [Candidatus Omnitrophota bacterium]